MGALLALVAVAVVGFLFLLIALRRPKSQNPSGKPGESKGVALVANASGEVDPRPTVRLLYGTQTGTAERFAKQLGNELRRKYGDSTRVVVLDVENYKAADRLEGENVVLFLMATYGDGEPTDNAADFYSWLVSEVEATENGEKEPYLQSVHYGVFGLGNKQYEHFNAVGKRIHSGMKALGATPVVRRGDGDDDGCIDDDYDKWCEELLDALATRPQLLGAAAAAGGGASAPPPAYDVRLLGSDAAGARLAAPFAAGGGGASAHDPLLATVSEVHELHTAASDRSCVHVELDISGAPGLRYEAGDHVGVFAANGDAIVATAAQLLGLPLDTVFELRPPAAASAASGELAEPFRGPTTLAVALARFADLLSSPHKDALLALASCASDPAEAARLARLASTEGKAEYHSYVVEPHRSLLEVMADHPSARPPLGLFFGSVAPRLQPRFYSISSGPSAHPRSVHVTCAVVRERMPSGRLHEGVASNWLARARPGDKAPVFIRHSTFKLPKEPSAPVIMVGPGTGLAPFRGFIQERELALRTATRPTANGHAAAANGGAPPPAASPGAAAAAAAGLGPALLFFGCRHRHHDYIYESELAAALDSGALSQLHVAFSRDADAKDYVQHHMKRQGAALYALLRSPAARVYVCGDAKRMAKDVHHALVEVVRVHGGLSAGQAEAFVKELSDTGRYLKDVW